VLHRAGFAIHHVSGGHYILKREDRADLRVTLLWHSKDLKRRTLTSIINQAGLTVEEFLDLV
jgi:predicted RNA binding protein YcfA (HicA-like mRNA interferase family)